MQNKIFTFSIILKRCFLFVCLVLDVVVVFSIKVDLDKIEDSEKSESYNEKQFTILPGERGFQSVCPSCSDLWITSIDILKKENKKEKKPN